MPSVLRQHFDAPKNVGVLSGADADICQRSAAWGDEIRLTAVFADRQIAELKWQAAGRPELLAGMSLASIYILGGGAIEHLPAELENQLELSTSNRYLLLLIEDGFTALMKCLEG